jgi:hypothetical protein
LITVADQRVVAPASVYYLTPNTTSVLIHDPGYVIFGIGAVYLSSIISSNSTQNGPQDSWGNIKVPRIESLKDVLPDADGWKVLPEGPPVSYSSLVGVTVVNVSTRGNSTFVMTSSYFELSCPNGPQLLPWDDEVVWSRANGTGYLRGSGQTVQGIGYQRFPSSDTAGDQPFATFSIGTFTPYSNSYNQTTTPSAPRNIIFQSTTTNPDDDPHSPELLRHLLNRRQYLATAPDHPT